MMNSWVLYEMIHQMMMVVTLQVVMICNLIVYRNQIIVCLIQKLMAMITILQLDG